MKVPAKNCLLQICQCWDQIQITVKITNHLKFFHPAQQKEHSLKQIKRAYNINNLHHLNLKESFSNHLQFTEMMKMDQEEVLGSKKYENPLRRSKNNFNQSCKNSYFRLLPNFFNEFVSINIYQICS